MAATSLRGFPVYELCRSPFDLRGRYQRILKLTGNRNLLLSANSANRTNSEETDIAALPSLGEVSPSSVNTDYPINRRAACPWDFKVTRDATRFPTIMHEARCLCDECFNSSGKHRCEPVHRYVHVLRRTDACVDGLYVYKAAVERIVVACTCATKRVLRPLEDPDVELLLAVK